MCPELVQHLRHFMIRFPFLSLSLSLNNLFNHRSLLLSAWLGQSPLFRQFSLKFINLSALSLHKLLKFTNAENVLLTLHRR